MRATSLRPAVWLLAGFSLAVNVHAANVPAGRTYSNSLGMRLVQVEAGTFKMGCLNGTAVSSEEEKKTWRTFAGPEYLPNGDWDEHPAHKVTISRAFYMSQTEVTIAQFQQFRSDYEGSDKYAPYATNISWNEAAAFCKWLSDKEGKTYRLPTEAEWEYACRAGTNTRFWSGNEAPPQAGKPNPWGLKNMHAAPLEWCLDWHGQYPDQDQVDPVGPAGGLAKVARGGGLDRSGQHYYLRSANRAGYVPYFPPFGRDGGSVPSYQKQMPIGFRVVLADKPDTKPLPYRKPFIQQCVRQDIQNAAHSPDPDKPYFRNRPVLPVPPENIPKVNRRRAVEAAGLHPGFLDHSHGSGMEVCSNGDVLALYRTHDHENEGGPEVGIIAARLRFGAEKWDMPDILLDYPDTHREGGLLLWNDNGVLHRFGRSYAMPLQICVSTDNGATFSDVRFPEITGKISGYNSPQNTAFRAPDGTIFVSCDRGGSRGFLWTSKDNGRTWFDPGGSTGGRHTTNVMLKDGRILGMGGKERSIDGYTPKSITSDRGKTWEITKSIFAALKSNQKPSILRLASGRILFATDFQTKFGRQPEGMKRRGAYLAYSEDEARTWTIKKLPGAQPHEHAHIAKKSKNAGMIGYSTLRQGPNKLIHLVTTVNHPNLHFVFNEAWLLQTGAETSEVPAEPAATKMGSVRKYKKYYPNGNIKCVHSGGTADTGRFLLHGNEKWYYENGNNKWHVRYDKGKKVGKETCWAEDGNVIWSWIHKEDGTSIWTHWWPNGQRKSESTWRNHKCEGKAMRWARDGKVVDTVEFLGGMPADSPPFVKMTGVIYPD